MASTGKLKQLAKKKLDAAKKDLLFRIEMERQKLFFDKSLKLKLLEKAGLLALGILLNELLKGGSSTKENKEFLHNNLVAKAILKFTSDEFNDDALSEILCKCFENEETFDFDSYIEDVEPEELIKSFGNKSDIDKKFNLSKIKKLQELIGSTKQKYTNTENKAREVANRANGFIVTGIITYKKLNKEDIKSQLQKEKDEIKVYLALLQYIIQEIKSLFTKSEHPSKFRTKYLGKLIRNVYGIVKDKLQTLGQQAIDEFNEIKNTLQKIDAALKQLDTILITFGVMSALYLINRKLLQNESRKSLKQISKDIVCKESEIQPENVVVTPMPFKITLNCPTNTDNVCVPQVPLALKFQNLDVCEIMQNEEIIQKVKAQEDLTTIAIIRNIKEKDKLIPLRISKDSFVSQETVIARIGKSLIYSPVNGYIDKVTKTEIIIRDIFEPNQDFLIQQTELLGKKYERLNNVKAFLKEYYALSLYPILLSTSISTSVFPPEADEGVAKRWNLAKGINKLINKSYDKNIKKITGKDNVEEHAKNEILNKIKDAIEKRVEKFYKNLKSIGVSSINAARVTKAKKEEFNLFEYYALDLGKVLNGINSPSDIEIEFRNEINTFLRKRIILEEYSVVKLISKIDSLIKKIEKGISVGNYFQKALDIFNTKKKISDVKKWLTGLADKNNKLNDIEKVEAINSVIFLFELYLEYDQLVQKYNVIKKETTNRLETQKEGNWILSFTQKLWKDYDNLQKEINHIQKLIESLSLLQTFSIIDYEGKQARLYTLSDKLKCNPKNTDFKPSAYGYDDIEYWLKYCSYATLASVTNPATGWSTGWILPSPILFPVIYIPIKPISTKWGFIVLGISICGIWIYPWVLMANLGSSYTTPFGDPTAPLKREINALKLEISDQLAKLKKETFKKLIEANNKKLDALEPQVKQFKEEFKKLRSNKPKRVKVNKEGNKKVDNLQQGVKNEAVYLQQLAEWSLRMVQLQEIILTKETELWKLQIKQRILQEAYTTGKSVKGVSESLDKTEDEINSKLDKLTDATDNVNKILSGLPISIEPVTANFGLTLKNTKPVITIMDELDDNIIEGPLSKVTDKFKLNAADLTSPSYAAKINLSAVNYSVYEKALSVVNLAVIKKDPFP